MKYLNEDISVEFTGLNVQEDGVYIFDVRINSFTGTLIFKGNMFLRKGQTKATLYLNDIIDNYTFVNKSILKPIESSIINTNYIYPYYVSLDVNGEVINVVSDTVFHVNRYPNYKGYLDCDAFEKAGTIRKSAILLQGYASDENKLIPRYPFMNSDEYCLNIAIEENRASNGILEIDGEVYKQSTYSLRQGESTITNTLTDLYHDAKYSALLPTVVVDTSGFMGDDGKYVDYVKSLDFISIWDEDDVIVGDFTTIGKSKKVFDVHTLYNRVYIGDYSKSGDYIEIVSPQSTPFTISFNLNIVKDTSVTISDIMVYQGNPWAKETVIKFGTSIIGKLDMNCYSRYYLAWQDRMGGMQSQPFTGTDTYSESFSKNNIVDLRNRKFVSTINVDSTWKIQSGWLKDAYMPYYESIFTSPYLLLFDTDNNKSYNVLVTDTKFEEKTFENNGRKLFNLQLNLELNKPQTIKY